VHLVVVLHDKSKKKNRKNGKTDMKNNIYVIQSDKSFSAFKYGGKIMKKALLTAIILLVSVSVGLATDRHVPAEYPTIQAAIDAAVNGDTVIIASGTYTGPGNSDIYFRGKAITVKSEDGPESCIIDCQNLGGGFKFRQGEDANSVLTGLTIVNARGISVSYYAIDCRNSNPTISNCNIKYSDIGIYCGNTINLRIINCNIVQNSDGIRCSGSNVTITNSIVRGNNRQFYLASGVANVTYSNVQGGWEGQGNIDTDALLTPDGHLRAGSACIDAGDPNSDPVVTVDIDGEARIGGTRVDIGSDKFHDSDSDGLPDWWEKKYFGSSTAAEPDADPDLDGYTNLVEYEIYSSDPTFSAVIYYANSSAGDDSYDGLAAEWDGVHGPKKTIQAAIDAAVNSDTVIAAPGWYSENINFLGKAITVRSSNPASWDVVKNTIINGNCQGSCVVFNHNETNGSILEGFTLTHGKGTLIQSYRYHDGYIRNEYVGGGIFCLDSSPTIRRCNIKANGYDICETNYTFVIGSGIALLGRCQAEIVNCFITDNLANSGLSGGGGSGITIRSNMPEAARSTIRNCTIANNKAPDATLNSYQVDCWDARPIISNTIIWSNNGPPLPDDWYGTSYTRGLFIADPNLVTYCCIRDAYIFKGKYDQKAEPYDLTMGVGNINEGPFFVQPFEVSTEDRDYHLFGASPCINSGDPAFVGGGETDIDGQARIMGGRIDIGADEVVPEIVVSKPAGGEVWSAGSTHTIEWTSYGAAVVKILFSSNGGGHWQVVANRVGDSGSYRWHLPYRVDSSQCMISVVPGVPDANVVCTGSGLFTIQRYRGRVLPPLLCRKEKMETGPEMLDKVKWQFETAGPVTAGVTIGCNSWTYITCEDGFLYNLNKNGSLIWSYDANTPLASSAAVSRNGRVFFAGTNGKLYAIDCTGRLLWTHSTDGPCYSTPVIGPDGKVYIGSLDGMLYALGQDGSELWSFETGGIGAAGGSVFATPVFGKDRTIYIAGLYDPNEYALNPADGSIKWSCSFASKGWPFATPALGADGTIYQTLLYDTRLYAIKPEDGTIKWSIDLADAGSGWFDPNYAQVYGDADGWSSPVVGPDGTIYVSFDDPYLRAVNPDGSIKWVAHIGNTGGFTMTVGGDGLVYAASDDMNLYVIDKDGNGISAFTGNGGLSFPVLGPGHSIIVSDANNKVWSIEDYKVHPKNKKIDHGFVKRLFRFLRGNKR